MKERTKCVIFIVSKLFDLASNCQKWNHMPQEVAFCNIYTIHFFLLWLWPEMFDSLTTLCLHPAGAANHVKPIWTYEWWVKLCLIGLVTPDYVLLMPLQLMCAASILLHSVLSSKHSLTGEKSAVKSELILFLFVLPVRLYAYSPVSPKCAQTCWKSKVPEIIYLNLSLLSEVNRAQPSVNTAAVCICTRYSPVWENTLLRCSGFAISCCQYRISGTGEMFCLTDDMIWKMKKKHVG